MALLAAPLVGVLLARHTTTGVAVTVALIYIPIVFLNLPLALVLWVPLTFMTRIALPGLRPGGDIRAAARGVDRHLADRLGGAARW